MSKVRKLNRQELLGPVVEAMEYFGGRATTNQLSEYLEERYPQDGYQFRWAQQELKKKKYKGVYPKMVAPLKRGGEWSLVPHE